MNPEARFAITFSNSRTCTLKYTPLFHIETTTNNLILICIKLDKKDIFQKNRYRKSKSKAYSIKETELAVKNLPTNHTSKAKLLQANSTK